MNQCVTECYVYANFRIPQIEWYTIHLYAKREAFVRIRLSFHHTLITYCLCYGYGFFVGYSVRVLRIYSAQINSAPNVLRALKKLHSQLLAYNSISRNSNSCSSCISIRIPPSTVVIVINSSSDNNNSSNTKHRF